MRRGIGYVWPMPDDPHDPDVPRRADDDDLDVSEVLEDAVEYFTDDDDEIVSPASDSAVQPPG